jgi:23S rRNA pseudouridine955/2504/2580 synthase
MNHDTVLPPVRYLRISADRAGQRLDNFLLTHLKGVPRSWVYRVIRRGEVRVNKARAKPGQTLVVDDQVRIPPVRRNSSPPQSPGKAWQQTITRAILYEDKTLLVLNKPSGVAVHGGSGVNHGVIEILRSLHPSHADWELVHRLDRDTSGCLLIAKKRAVLRQLHALQQHQHIHKRYLALVAGHWPESCHQVTAPLRKNILHSGERLVKVSADGKFARTHFRIQRRVGPYTLVEARLETGRTHQIRVHTAHIGTPILGDDKYGDLRHNQLLRQQGLKRLFLHAWQLRFRWPNAAGYYHFTAPLAPELQHFIDRQ